MVWGADGRKPAASNGNWCGAGKSPAAGAPMTPKQDETATQAPEDAESAAKIEKSP